MTDPSAIVSSIAPVLFRIERSELNLEFTFGSPFWPLANDVAGVYAGLLHHMREFGVTSHVIRPDSGDGTLGGFNVNFWMMNYGAIVRIRLDGVEVNAPASAVDIAQFERSVLALDSGLREAQRDLRYGNYAVTAAMHGRVDGVESKQFLDGFTRNSPVGLGNALGSGAIFYFEGQTPSTLLTVSADLSARIAGGLFVKVHNVFDGSLPLASLRQASEEQLERSLKALGLDVGNR